MGKHERKDDSSSDDSRSPSELQLAVGKSCKRLVPSISAAGPSAAAARGGASHVLMCLRRAHTASLQKEPHWLCGVVESHEGPPKGVQCSGALCDMPTLGCAAGSSPERKRSKKDKKEKHKKKVRGALAVQHLAPWI